MPAHRYLEIIATMGQSMGVTVLLEWWEGRSWFAAKPFCLQHCHSTLYGPPGMGVDT